MKRQSLRTKLRNLSTDVDDMIDTFAAVKGPDAALIAIVLMDLMQLTAITLSGIEDDDHRQAIGVVAKDISRNIYNNLLNGLDLSEEDSDAAHQLAQTIFEKVVNVTKRT